MCDVRRAMCDVRRAMCDVRRAMCDVRCATCDVRCAMCDVRRYNTCDRAIQFYLMVRVKTIDAHAAGEPLRLIVDGFPAPRGKTMLEKRDWVKRHADHLRRALMLEPRGHADMYGAILTEPVSPGSHAGVLFMHNEGYSTMCGHGIVAVTTIALERGLIMPGPDGATIVYDSPAGTIRARANLSDSRVHTVSFVNVPSFVLHGGLA